MSSCQTLPAWGLMQDGECWEQPTLALRIRGTESGLWPTPTASQARSEGMLMQLRALVDAGTLSREEAEGMAQGSLTPPRMKPWPTPTCNMVSGGPNHNSPQVLAGKHGINLAGAVMKWRTPQSADAKSTKVQKGHQTNLTHQVMKWPTPTAHNAKETNAPSETKRNEPTLASRVGGKLNPTWVEWLMGWPLGWTDLKPLEMDKFQQWQQQHGSY
jgi:hypothetical protein